MSATDGQRAPVQGAHYMPKGAGREPGTIAWVEHLAVFEPYAKRYGRDQSAERLAERGGFSWGEIVMFTGAPPKTWRPL